MWMGAWVQRAKEWEKIKDELNNGGQIMSYEFSDEGWQPATKNSQTVHNCMLTTHPPTNLEPVSIRNRKSLKELVVPRRVQNLHQLGLNSLLGRLGKDFLHDLCNNVKSKFF
jgi:hypothetical protein